MPCGARLDAPGTLHHVIATGERFVVTSNHVHLIVKDDAERNIIPQSIGLVAGRTAQEYNRRKRRKGTFWEDRYHSTAIETGDHSFSIF